MSIVKVHMNIKFYEFLWLLDLEKFDFIKVLENTLCVDKNIKLRICDSYWIEFYNVPMLK